MQKPLLNAALLIKKVVLLLLIYEICRVLFYVFNYSHFESLSLKELLICFFFGLRFDLSIIVVINSLFIIFHLFPFPLRSNRIYQNTLNGLFYFTNGFALLLNCIDLAYFRFIFKRSTADVFDLVATGTDFISLIPAYLTDYWYVFIIWVLLLALLIRGNRKIVRHPSQPPQGGGGVVVNEGSDGKKATFNYLAEFVVFILLTGVATFAYRGGIQLKPISIINAGEYGSAKNIPLIINTPFSIIKTLEAPDIDERNYFPEAELKNIYTPVCHYSQKEFKPLNVVLIIMESFSKEYIGALNGGQGYTPFLDSLISQSLVFENAFANGKKSMEGIPAIVAGIPALMTEPYITSNYAGNNITSLANTLKKKGYSTAFYHGGKNGTMGFDAFTKLAGFDNYYGRSEYQNDTDYDGHWGIYDEPFFQYAAQQIKQTPEPFLSAVFSLSSHHPYKIPDHYKSLFEKESPVHQSMRYADHSLKKFFEAVSKMDWFNNTLFVITADHTGDAESAAAGTRVGMYEIPIVFYKSGSELRGKNSNVIQQIDIMPSVLHYLGYSDSFFSFGKSAFDTTTNDIVINYINESYQIIDNTYSLQFDGTKSVALFNYKEDIALTNNLINTADTLKTKHLEKQVKAVVQSFNHSLIHNKMTAEQ